MRSAFIWSVYCIDGVEAAAVLQNPNGPVFIHIILMNYCAIKAIALALEI